MKTAWLCLTFLLLAASVAQAQYHLTELGARAGVGPAVRFSGQNHSTGFAAQATGFYSHWVCGKGWGYQFDAGLNYADQYFQHNHGVIQGSHNAFIQATWLHLGAGLKLRPHNYHRPREWHVVLGPVLQTRLWSRVDLHDGNGGTRFSGGGEAFRFGGQASLWLRFPMGKNVSWFLAPGVEVLTPYRTQLEGYGDRYYMAFWQPTFQAGFTFWNNR